MPLIFPLGSGRQSAEGQNRDEDKYYKLYGAGNAAFPEDCRTACAGCRRGAYRLLLYEMQGLHGGKARFWRAACGNLRGRVGKGADAGAECPAVHWGLRHCSPGNCALPYGQAARSAGACHGRERKLYYPNFIGAYGRSQQDCCLFSWENRRSACGYHGYRLEPGLCGGYICQGEWLFHCR